MEIFDKEESKKMEIQQIYKYSYLSIINNIGKNIPTDNIDNNQNLILLYKIGYDIYKCLIAGLEIIYDKHTDMYDYNGICINEIRKILSELSENSKWKYEENFVKKFVDHFNKMFPSVEHLYNRGRRYIHETRNKTNGSIM